MDNLSFLVALQSNRHGETAAEIIKVRLGFWWWSRRELNSRLTGLPKNFLHAYAAIILKYAPLRPKEPIRRNLSSAAAPTSHRCGRTPPFLTPAPSRRGRGADELLNC